MEASKGLVGPLLVAVVLMGLMDSTGAYVFYAGGRDGWVQHPSENYNDWAGRNRFQVNDTIVFRYKKGEDSVLVVTEQDYDTCNVSNPIQRLDGGDSVFKFDRSGSFFFISGAPGHCKEGQKLIVVVMGVRPTTPISSPPSLPPSPPPSSKPPVSSPASSPSPSPAPHGRVPVPSPKPKARPPTPAPSARPPVSAPSIAPAAGSPPPPSSGGAPSGGEISPAPGPSEPPASSSSNASKLSLVMALMVLSAAFLA